MAGRAQTASCAALGLALGLLLGGALAATTPLLAVGKGGDVSVAFGGYHASAGLGGGAGGGGALGGLHASAGTPDGHRAAAGLGGGAGGAGAGGLLYAGAESSAGAAAGAGLAGAAGAGGAAGGSGAGVTKVKTVGLAGPGAGAGAGATAGGGVSKNVRVHGSVNAGGLFDNIFNIPTSVLRSVNQYLNNRSAQGGLRKTVHVSVDAGAVQPKPAPLYRTKAVNTGDGGVYKVYAAQPAAAAGVAVTAAGAGSKNYDDIFNIPISTLNAVNRFLNNLG